MNSHIWDFIVEDSSIKADAWIDRLDSNLRLLATQLNREKSLITRRIPLGLGRTRFYL
jgi:hypothetical protein